MGAHHVRFACSQAGPLNGDARKSQTGQHCITTFVLGLHWHVLIRSINHHFANASLLIIS